MQAIPLLSPMQAIPCKVVPWWTALNLSVGSTPEEKYACEKHDALLLSELLIAARPALDQKCRDQQDWCKT